MFADNPAIPAMTLEKVEEECMPGPLCEMRTAIIPVTCTSNQCPQVMEVLRLKDINWREEVEGALLRKERITRQKC